MSSSLCHLSAVNTGVRNQFRNYPIGVSDLWGLEKERERETHMAELRALGANTKHSISSLVNINIFLEQHVPPTRIPSVTDGE